MNPQEKLIQYAEELKSKSNTGISEMTAQQIMGKAFSEGVRYSYNGQTSQSCFVRREGQTIIVIDQTRTVKDTINGKEITETETEVMRIEL